ncbi:MAG TPA: potassium transporter [Mycobacterium sp.]|nr:potassium transporter [Mycobacterium sp.]
MSVDVENCDVCIVGAGLAGMNALFVASRYLSPDQRIILVDRRQRVGGMWVDTYPYVRLHQPHPMFTAGNIGWTLGQKPSHLASKDEVLGHFEHCLGVIKRHQRVDEFYGWAAESDEEADGIVRLTCRAEDGRTMVIETPRLIKAYGVRVQPNDPLELSSHGVHSVSPDSCDMRGAPIGDSTAPVWVVGGGKAAMDTVHTLLCAYPGREVNLVAGSGTLFNSRDRFFPEGMARWRATMVSTLASEVTRRFDGTNEDEVWDWHRATFGLWVTPETGNFLAGVLSEEERKTIAGGLNHVLMDHLVDVVDDAGGPRMMLRSGSSKPVEPGSWFVNCTGYLTNRDFPYEPYVSPSGKVLSIQPQSATMHLTSYTAYFNTHLLFAGRIRDVPLYELDMLGLYRKSRKAFAYTIFALAQYNISLCADNLPAKAFRECGIDFDRWYPLPRRALATVKFMRTHRGERDRLRGALDVVRERYGVRCGPLGSDVAQAT